MGASLETGSRFPASISLLPSPRGLPGFRRPTSLVSQNVETTGQSRVGRDLMEVIVESVQSKAMDMVPRTKVPSRTA